MSTAKTQQRISFSTVKNRVPYPDLLEVQLKSFRDFFQMDTTAENRKSEGLYKVFQENFPITDTRNNFVLEFIDYYIDPPRYSIEECLERGLTYRDVYKRQGDHFAGLFHAVRRGHEREPAPEVFALRVYGRKDVRGVVRTERA